MPKRDHLTDFLDEPPAIIGERKLVPNLFPKITNTDYKIAIIGEAPGSDETALGEPFVGASGRELDKYLSKVGILRDACYIGNICQYQPPGNKLAAFDWNGPEIQGGLEQLKNDLSRIKPNLVWLLGGSALHAFRCGMDNAPAKRKTKEGTIFSFPHSIGDWRGSLFSSCLSAPIANTKCIASYHPAAALRNYEWMPLILLDLLFKVCKEAKSPILTLPKRNLRVNVSLTEILSELDKIAVEKPLISVDIEGGVGTMSCLSVATSASYSFIVPFTNLNGSSLWEEYEETLIFRSLARVLGDARIPKVLQNSLYDRFVLQYSYGIVVRGTRDDTMLRHWELYCELEKSLGFQCSLYTNEPYYKSDRKSDDRDDFWRYCCRDSATTYEINEKLSAWVKGPAKDHYDFNVNLLNPLLYMELRGIRYDSTLAKHRLRIVNQQIQELQYDLDQLSGLGYNTDVDKHFLLERIRDECCYKADRNKPKAGNDETYDMACRIVAGGLPLSRSNRGFFNMATGKTLNTKSKVLKDYLYETLKLPPQYDPKTKALTTDNQALLRLTKEATNETQRKALDLCISIAELRTRSQMLEIHSDSDGRVRAGYNIVGTETARITCYTSPTGSGYNLQTIPDFNPLRPEGHPLRSGMRDLFVADSGYYIFQCDLKGSDGWTIGANLASLGETTMLEDLKEGIKPAARIAYMLRHGNESLKTLRRSEIKDLLKEIKKDDFDYFMCKCGIWGICYLMGVDRLRDLIFEQSEGKLTMSRSDVASFRNSVYACYRPNIWHTAVQNKLSRQPYPPKLTSASGHTRMFFGRYNEILGEALANEPQENTTYATNRAAYNLWNDPENREGKKLRVEPLHQVHDALLGQFKISDTSWAINKIKQYFDNKLIIAGIPIVIPFEGSYGTNWAMDEKSKVGTI